MKHIFNMNLKKIIKKEDTLDNKEFVVKIEYSEKDRNDIYESEIIEEVFKRDNKLIMKTKNLITNETIDKVSKKDTDIQVYDIIVSTLTKKESPIYANFNPYCKGVGKMAFLNHDNTDIYGIGVDHFDNYVLAKKTPNTEKYHNDYAYEILK